MLIASYTHEFITNLPSTESSKINRNEMKRYWLQNAAHSVDNSKKKSVVSVIILSQIISIKSYHIRIIGVFSRFMEYEIGITETKL